MTNAVKGENMGLDVSTLLRAWRRYRHSKLLGDKRDNRDNKQINIKDATER